MDKDEWPVDDEYDALNDETFGDDDGAEFNWEDAQSKFSDFEKLKPTNGKAKSQQESRVVYNAEELEHSFQKELQKTFEDDFDNENALEESISRLVMDDFEDEEDEEAVKSKLRRLGGGARNTYFMPPQVANKHLHWFMDKELPGGSSLLGSSVWSMHPTATPATAPTNHQPNIIMSQRVPDHRPPAHITISTKVSDSSVPLNINNVTRTKPSGPQPSQKPVFKTVEEIERELLDGSDIASSNDVNTQSKPSTNQRPLMMTAEQLERELMMDDTSTPPPTQPVMPTTPMKTQHLQHQTNIPSPENGPRHVLPGSPSFPQNMMPTASPPGVGRPLGMNINMNQLMMQRMPPPHMVQNPAAFAQARRMMTNAQLHQQVQFAFQQQQHMRMMQQMSPQMRHRMPPMMPFPPMHPGRPGFPMMMHPNQGPPHPQFMHHFRSDDIYRGLMNEKDKQRLRNISIIQLQNDHPYTTDYYSLMYKVKDRTIDPKRQRDCLLKLFPNKCNENSNRNNYQPAHFENSLGKLQAVSALAPKKAIDTVIRVVDAGPTNRSGMKAYRYLLLEIEKLYECLLKIQEGDIRKSHLHNADDFSQAQRDYNERKVKDVLDIPAKLSEILSVHKGKMLVSRLMPLMDPTFRFQLLAHMILNFPDWGGPKDNEIEKTYPFLRHCIFSGNMSCLILAFNAVVPIEVYESMLRSKFGVSLLMVAFHRAEILITTPPKEEEKEKAEYLNLLYLKEIGELVQTVLGNPHTLAVPIEFPANILTHFSRWGYAEDELRPLEATIEIWKRKSIPILH